MNLMQGLAMGRVIDSVRQGLGWYNSLVSFKNRHIVVVCLEHPWTDHLPCMRMVSLVLCHNLVAPWIRRNLGHGLVRIASILAHLKLFIGHWVGCEKCWGGELLLADRWGRMGSSLGLWWVELVPRCISFVMAHYWLLAYLWLLASE